MKKIRINELARELEVKAHEILDKLPELGVHEKKTHSSSIDEDVAEKLRSIFGFSGGGLGPAAEPREDEMETAAEEPVQAPAPVTEAPVAAAPQQPVVATPEPSAKTAEAAPEPAAEKPVHRPAPHSSSAGRHDASDPLCSASRRRSPLFRQRLRLLRSSPPRLRLPNGRSRVRVLPKLLAAP